jgi:hypothetical protein
MPADVRLSQWTPSVPNTSVVSHATTAQTKPPKLTGLGSESDKGRSISLNHAASRT